MKHGPQVFRSTPERIDERLEHSIRGGLPFEEPRNLRSGDVGLRFELPKRQPLEYRIRKVGGAHSRAVGVHGTQFYIAAICLPVGPAARERLDGHFP